MAESASRVLEGVFAISKPPSLSSAQVLRDLQHAFGPSETFRPLLAATEATENQNKQRSKRRKIDRHNAFKMGHGGTLDPMATGVLIVGIGRGTKFLQNFLYCTKTYETVVLFGKSTDTYDVAGRVVESASTSQITQKLVEEKLNAFRGNVKQVPPIYSALKIDGMKAYDYARSGKELPRELAAREMNVSECVMTEFYDAGQHGFRWPADEAPEEEKRIFTKLVHTNDLGPGASKHHSPVSEDARIKEEDVKPPGLTETATAVSEDHNALSQEEKAVLHTHELSGLSDKIADAPAARVRLTVSSGFYVRSFAHDLGIACGSYGTMAELARTRQAEFTTTEPTTDDLVPALHYEDIGKGEVVWGPKIKNILGKWLEKNPSPDNHNSRRHPYTLSSSNRLEAEPKREQRNDIRKRRNSSSPEV